MAGNGTTPFPVTDERANWLLQQAAQGAVLPPDAPRYAPPTGAKGINQRVQEATGGTGGGWGGRGGSGQGVGFELPGVSFSPDSWLRAVKTGRSSGEADGKWTKPLVKMINKEWAYPGDDDIRAYLGDNWHAYRVAQEQERNRLLAAEDTARQYAQGNMYTNDPAPSSSVAMNAAALGDQRQQTEDRMRENWLLAQGYPSPLQISEQQRIANSYQSGDAYSVPPADASPLPTTTPGFVYEETPMDTYSSARRYGRAY